MKNKKPMVDTSKSTVPNEMTNTSGVIYRVPIATTNTGTSATMSVWNPVNTTNNLPDWIATPVGDGFMLLKGSYVIHANGKTYALSRIFSKCKNIRYIKVDNEIIIPKPVWEAVMTYVKCEDGYADLTLTEFLDKTFAR